MPHADPLIRVEQTLTREVGHSFRVSAIQGMFDIPVADHEEATFIAELPALDGDWRIGAIMGPSGSGKTTIARAAWPDAYQGPFKWDRRPIIDHFPKGDIEGPVRLLTAVGLSSPKAWIRPYAALSTGQQARADLARALAQGGDLVVVDEFTSTVDRTVAKAMSHAVQKAVRREGPKFVVVTCHLDVIEWLRPDWVWDTMDGSLRRERVQRPAIHLRMEQASRSVWPMFAGNHYLSAEIATSAQCFTAWVRLGDDDPDWRLAGFFSVMPAIGLKGWRRGHRTVVLPDFQGLGIGNRMIEETAEWLWRERQLRFRAVTSSRAIIFHRMKRPDMWRCVFAPHMKAAASTTGAIKSTSAGRLTTSWEYIPEEMRREATSPSPGTEDQGTGSSMTGQGAASASVPATSTPTTARSTKQPRGKRGKVPLGSGGISLRPSKPTGRS